MRAEPIGAVDDFVAHLMRAHPGLRVTCDRPDSQAGSTWIDIHVGRNIIVVEFDPRRGFGFAGAEDDTQYGTPSALFVRGNAAAIAQIDAVLRDATMSAART